MSSPLGIATLDWHTPIKQALAPAAKHAAVGDELPTLGRLPQPFRWAGRAVARCVYALGKPLTSRQKAYNLSVLDAVNRLTAGPAAINRPEDNPRRFDVVYNVDGVSWMSYSERVLLYGLVYGIRPQRVLEVGTFQGGSARVMVAAMDDADTGKIYCVDPDPRMSEDTAARIAHRATVIAGPSPEALLEAEKLAGGKFDFTLIDGDHSYDGVVRDIEGSLPVVADGSLLTFHDAHYEPVQRGIDDMIKAHPELSEVGMLSSPANPDKENPGIYWGGIRVLRFK